MPKPFVRLNLQDSPDFLTFTELAEVARGREVPVPYVAMLRSVTRFLRNKSRLDPSRRDDAVARAVEEVFVYGASERYVYKRARRYAKREDALIHRRYVPTAPADLRETETLSAEDEYLAAVGRGEHDARRAVAKRARWLLDNGRHGLDFIEETAILFRYGDEPLTYRAIANKLNGRRRPLSARSVQRAEGRAIDKLRQQVHATLPRNAGPALPAPDSGATAALDRRRSWSGRSDRRPDWRWRQSDNPVSVAYEPDWLRPALPGTPIRIVPPVAHLAEAA